MGVGIGTRATLQPNVLAALRGAQYQEVVAGDFVSLTAHRDPNGVNNADLVVAAGGLLTIDIDEDGAVRTARDIQDHVSWRMNHLPTWRGDGSQVYATRLTPQAVHTGAGGKMILAMALVDRDGDTTLAQNMPVIGVTNVSTLIAGNILLGSSPDGTGSTALGTIVLGSHSPGGVTGDETQSGAPGGVAGGGSVTTYKPGDVPPFKGYWGLDSPEQTLSDGYFPCLAVGWDTLGANTGTWQVKMEWAIVELYEPGVLL